MPLSEGRRLGPYEIVGSIGSGGMGEVYRARDTRLNRQVAIKVLPDALARDPARLRRLQREAQLLASLNHPHIAVIHGLEESDGTCALVMELVEGEDLKQRIARGPMPVEDALAVVRQIAIALEAAHGQGIVHRDLKPANIKLRPDGAIKVLDFGLAKSTEAEPLQAVADESPTVTTPAAMTEAGLILGTAAYMSPEQARGQSVDKRADIWAFGCVLYELLTGRRPFGGGTVTETLAAVLEREPDWSPLPPSTPTGVRRLLRRCLEKNPTRRLHDMGDARIEIEDAQAGAESDRGIPVAAAASPRRRIAQWAIVTVALLLTGAAGWLLRPVPEAGEVRLEITTPPTADASFALSPDGRSIAFVAKSGKGSQLWLRSLDRNEARPLAGTERGTLPFWSPDSRSIAFFADMKLKRVDVDGSSPRTIAVNCAVPLGGTWGGDGTILYADNPGGPIRRTSAEGGASAALTKVEGPAQRNHHSPRFLPDGRRFLFYAGGTPEARGVYLGHVDGSPPRRLFDADGAAVYTASGHLLFRRGQKLYAQRFDPAAGQLQGDAVAVADLANETAALSASPAGPIAYRQSPSDKGERQLVWTDRSGRVLERVVYADSAAMSPELSPDGSRVAVIRFANGNMDIWSYTRARGDWQRVTFDPGDDIFPLWSRDGLSHIFAGVRNAAPLMLFRRHLNEPPEKEEPLMKEAVGAFPMDWSADGRILLFNRPAPKGGIDLWAVPVSGADRTPFVVVATDANEGLAQFSPDGKWIAYQSDKTNREEIYLRPFPGPAQDVLVSLDGGNQPRWNPNGKEIFYIGADDRMMAVSIRLPTDKAALEIGKPVALFPTTIGSSVRLRYRQQYAVTPEGNFLLNSAVDPGNAPPIQVILNGKSGG